MKPKKILIICASGIGNTILFTPTLKALKEALPKAKITFLVTKSVFSEPIRESGLADRILISEDGLWRKLKTIVSLRREKFDCSVTAFPSNHWQFNVFAFLIGAEDRITHSYKIGKWRTLSFLQNIKVPADENLHDVEQNLNLLKPLGIRLPKDKQPLFYIDEKSQREVKKYWKDNELENKFVVGIHSGSGGVWQEAKRWPEEKFAKLCDGLIEGENVKVLIFGGPEEKELKEKIRNLSRHRKDIYIVEASLKKVAALIRRCNLFISNDSGLMHVAVAVRGPKVIGIFGPTNYKRTGPYGNNCYIVRREISCSPCLKYPFHSTSSRIKCQRNFECLKKIKVEDVINRVNQILR